MVSAQPHSIILFLNLSTTYHLGSSKLVFLVRLLEACYRGRLLEACSPYQLFLGVYCRSESSNLSLLLLALELVRVKFYNLVFKLKLSFSTEEGFFPVETYQGRLH